MKLKCPSCGFENDKEDRFCKNCGEPLPNPYTKKRKNEGQSFKYSSDKEIKTKNRIEKEERMRAEAKVKAEKEIKQKEQIKKGVGYLILLGIIIVFAFIIFGGGGGTSESISKPDPNLQVEREKLLDGLDNIHIGFKLPRSNGIDAVVGAAWYDLSYEAKEKYASVAAAWALCKYYEEQDFYVVRFRDWRTDKEVATLSLSATRGTSFEVK